jgi:hypothetical protein
MKALSVKQPWAHLIIFAGKNIENRTWPTNYRGPLAIHASKRKSSQEFYDAELICPDRAAAALRRRMLYPEECLYGAIIGTVDLVDCLTSFDSPWFQGPYGFVLANPRPLLVPVLVRGALGLWEWTERRCTSIGCKAYGEPIAEGHSCLP